MATNKHGIEFAEIAEMDPESTEAGTPVFVAETRAGSYVSFAFLSSVEGVAVYHVVSEQRGDFARLMDAILAKFMGNSATQVTFFNVVTEFMGGRDLDTVLDGFAREERVAEGGPHAGEKYEVLTGTWEPQGRHLQ